jgi:hypothetical protein
LIATSLKEYHLNVNKDIFESKWEQIRAQSSVWWGLLTEDDLTKVDKAPIKFDKYILILRVKYGYTREVARVEINKRVTELIMNKGQTPPII